MKLEMIGALQIIIVSILSYLPTVALSGWFEAWVAKKCGDDVPEQFGFLTLNPAVHFNIIGFGCLLIGKLFGDYLPLFHDLPGWGHYIPLNPSNRSSTKSVLEFMARGLAHLILSILAVFVLFGMFKWAISHQSQLTQHESMFQSIAMVFRFFLQQNMILSIIYLAIGCFRSIMFAYFPDFYLFSAQHLVWGLLLMLSSILIFTNAFHIIVETILIGLSNLLIVK